MSQVVSFFVLLNLGLLRNCDNNYMMLKCPRCNNVDPSYFYKGSKGIYCRKCIRFKRILLEEERKPLDYEVSNKAFNNELEYPLTKFQQYASNKCLEMIDKSDVLLNCVCGAGKTELVIASIAKFLKAGKKVAYAISRKEVVKELSLRFANVFKTAKVVAVYGGHSKDIVGDIIVCTTHQLYRYHKTFDLLIIDEVDAFPFKGDAVLWNIAKNTCKGHIIYSTATIDEKLKNLIEKGEVYEIKLSLRAHFRPLVVPKVVKGVKLYLLIYLYFLLRKTNGQIIVFVSSKNMAIYLNKIFKMMFSSTFVYSDSKSRNEAIDLFKNGKRKVIFATTVLERGVTFKGVNVVILNFHEGVFDSSSINQMLGRVGRDFFNGEGSSWVLTTKVDEEIKKALKDIKGANDEALSLLRSSD